MPEVVALRDKVSKKTDRPPALRGPMKSVVAEGHVYIRNSDGREELYNLADDPGEVRDLAREHRPKMIIASGSAIPRTIDFAAFRAVADEVGAVFMVDAAHFIGLVAGKAIPSPVPHADVVTFTTHKVLRGPRGGAIVCKAEHAKAIDKAAFPMMQGGPLMHAVAAKAVNLKECLQPEYQAYTRQVIANAQALTEGLAAEVALARRCLRHSALVPRAYQVTTGDAREGRQHWVAGRAGQACRRCGTAVRVVDEVPGDAGRRRTWWCPHCQPGPGPEVSRTGPAAAEVAWDRPLDAR